MEIVPLVVWIPVNPVPKGRPRFANGVTYTDKKTKEAEETIQWWLRKHKAKRLEGPVKIELHFHRADRRRADIDNLQKTILDAMNGICFKDDSQIVELHSILERGHDEPGIWLKVSAA